MSVIEELSPCARGAEDLSAKFGTPGWAELQTIARELGTKFGLPDDLMLANTLALGIANSMVMRGELVAIPLGEKLFMTTPEIYNDMHASVCDAVSLLDRIRELPPTTGREKSKCLESALDEWIEHFHPVLEVNLECFLNEEGQPDKRLSRAKGFTIMLAREWKAQKDKDAKAYRDRTSGEAKGDFWPFITEACRRARIEEPSIDSVEDWLGELANGKGPRRRRKRALRNIQA